MKHLSDHLSVLFQEKEREREKERETEREREKERDRETERQRERNLYVESKGMPEANRNNNLYFILTELYFDFRRDP